MKGRAPTRDDHARFCAVEGWVEVRSARGKSVRHHRTLELALTDGRILRTRISRPVDRSTYGAAMFRHILTDQLQVSAEEFWACVTHGTLPPRSTGAAAGSPRALPASVVHQLIHEVGLSETEIATLTKDQAIARLHAHWTSPPSA